MTTDSVNPNRLLILDDDEKINALMGKIASPMGFEIDCATTVSAFMARFKTLGPSVVILDIFLQYEDSLRAIDFLGRSQFKGAVILVSGFDYRFLRSVADVARDHGLHVLGTVEKANHLEKVGALLRSAYIGALGWMLSERPVAESR